MNADLLIYLFDENARSQVSVFLWLLGIALFIFWVWSAIYVANRKVEDQTRKICWLLIVLFLGPLGSILYLFLGREKAGGESSTKVNSAFEEWLKGDSSRAYLSKEEQLEAFKSYIAKT